MKQLTKEAFARIKAVFVAGTMGAGKTALVYKLLEYSNKPVYFIRHPKPELLEQFGYENLQSLDEIERCSDCVIYWDEPSTYLSTSDYKKNQIISKVLSLARQRNITMIISTSDTRAFLKGTEAFFDCWIVKDLEYSMTKQRSQIRKVIQDNSMISPEDFRLEVNEYILYCRNLREFNGRHTFELATGWSEELSTPYGLENCKKMLLKNTLKSEELIYSKQSLSPEEFAPADSTRKSDTILKTEVENG